jgi:hypothetical protein
MNGGRGGGRGRYSGTRGPARDIATVQFPQPTFTCVATLNRDGLTMHRWDMFGMMRGVNQGDGPSRFRNNTYVDDDIFEEVFRHTVYPAEILPTCRRAASGHSCPADSRDCRYGVAVLALTWTPLLFTNDDNKVMVESDRVWHLFNWCSGNISLFGIEKLDPPLSLSRKTTGSSLCPHRTRMPTRGRLSTLSCLAATHLASTRLRRRCQQGLPVCTIEDTMPETS